MQQYIYGNIGREGYRYVSSEPEFFADGQRTMVLRHLVNYDVFCPHGDLTAEQHQSFWMAVSNLDNPAAPDRLYLQASGGDSYRTGYYARGYMSDAEDGYLYDSRLLTLLKTQFSSFAQTMADAQAGNLQRLDCDQLPMEATLRPAALDGELLRNILLTLLQKKKVIIRLPVSGAEAMTLSREYILAIYERLPFEQRAVNGFVTGISAAKLKDEVALPAVVKIMLMDADADFTGIKSNAYQAVFDLADPNFQIVPMARETKDGKPLAYVPLIDFLADQSPETLDEFFRFCRSCMRKDVNGNTLSIIDYSMYLDFFAIGRGECSDNSIRSWAANVFSNSNSNSKWTPEIKKVLYTRIAAALTPERLKTYLFSNISGFDDLAAFGVPDEAEQSQLRVKKGSDVTIKDIHAALTLKMAELLMPYYKEGTEEALIGTLHQQFVTLGCEKYPFLREEKPTRTTVTQLEQLAFSAGSAKAPAMVKTMKQQVHETLDSLRDSTMARYREQYALQCRAGLDRIARWPGESVQTAAELYQDLKNNYLFEELIEASGNSGWNNAIGDRLAGICLQTVPRDLESYLRTFSFTRESLKCFADHGGQLTAEQQTACDSVMAGWKYVLTIHKAGEVPADEFASHMKDLEKIGFLLDRYPNEAQQELAAAVTSRLVKTGLAAWPCLTEDKPTAETVKQLNRLPLSAETGGSSAQVEAVRSGIYTKLQQYRESVLQTYRKQYEQQRADGLSRIAQWCSERYEPMAPLFDDLRGQYLFGELMAARTEGCWNEALGSRMVALGQEAQPLRLQDYKLLLAWEAQNRGLLAEQGGTLSDERIAALDAVRASWNRVLELSDRTCDSLAQLLGLFADIRTTAMAGTLRAQLMETAAEPVDKKGVTRDEIFANLSGLLTEGACDPGKTLLAKLVNACDDVKNIRRVADPVQLNACLSNCVRLEAAGLKDSGIRVEAWGLTGSAESLHKLLKSLMNYRAANGEPKIPNRQVRQWAADHLQSNPDLMYQLAVRYPVYREKLIPVLARKSGAVSREQLQKLYVSGCRRSLLVRGAGEETAVSWKRHVDELFPAWEELPEANQQVLPSEKKAAATGLILQTILLTLAGLIPGVVMLVTGTVSMVVCAVWIAALLIILTVSEIISVAAHNLVQRWFARWLGLGAVPGIILTIVVLVIHIL